MKSVRLLPVVIFAAIALLLFKGIGLVTTGGYVLTGTSVAVAAGGTSAPPAEAATPTMAMPAEPTMEDTNPVLEDHAPTMPTAEPPPNGGEAEAAAHGETPPVEGGVAPDHEPAADPAAGAIAASDAAAIDAAHPADEAAPSIPDPGEGVPMQADSRGNIAPLLPADGMPVSQKQLLERLAQRRAELEAFDQELRMRESLVQAAEKRIEERSTALAALEKRINAMIDEKKAADEGEFAALIKMYEGMKPADAATIFDALDMKVLVRLARGINPRKMAPIMAKMDASRAQDLTVRLANEQAQPTVDLGAGDLASLPQIVGQ